MSRVSLVPTLAAAALAGGSALVTASQVANSAASDLTLPDCAGYGVSVARVPATVAPFSAPDACLLQLVEDVVAKVEDAVQQAAAQVAQAFTITVDLTIDTVDTDDTSVDEMLVC